MLVKDRSWWPWKNFCVAWLYSILRGMLMLARNWPRMYCPYVVGRILVWYPTCLYIRVLAYRTYHCHYESKIPLPTCFFDQNLRNLFSTCTQNCDVIMS